MFRICGAVILATLLQLPGWAQARRPATCTIFEDRDFKGHYWVLRNGDDMKMVRQGDLGISDGIHRFIYQPGWNDKVSSFKVDAGCTLTLWENVDQKGHYFRSNRSYSYVGDRWNDKASEAICECGGLPNF